MRRAFGTVHTSECIRQHLSASSATKTPRSLLSVLVNIPLHDRRTPPCVDRPGAHLPSQDVRIRNMAPQKTSGIVYDLAITSTERQPGVPYWPLFHHSELGLRLKNQ